MFDIVFVDFYRSQAEPRSTITFQITYPSCVSEIAAKERSAGANLVRAAGHT